MLPSGEQQVFDRDEPISVRPVKSRIHMKFEPMGNYADTEDFSTMYFTLTLPNETVTLHNLRIVCPLQFSFWHKTGRKVENLAIAPKLWLNNALRSIEFRCNGQSFTQFPENHKHAEACWQWSDPYDANLEDSGSLLPVVGLHGEIQRTDTANLGFAERARDFRDGQDDTADPTGGYTYSTELEIIPDMLMFQSFVRKVYSQDMNSAAYAYEMEINLQFRRDCEDNNGLTGDVDQSDQRIATRLGTHLGIKDFAQQQAIWREVFRIGNPIVSSVMDTELENTGSSEVLDSQYSRFLHQKWDFYPDVEGQLVAEIVANGGHANTAAQVTVDHHGITGWTDQFGNPNVKHGDYLVFGPAQTFLKTQLEYPVANTSEQCWLQITGVHPVNQQPNQVRLIFAARATSLNRGNVWEDNAANRANARGNQVANGIVHGMRCRIYPGFIVGGDISSWRNFDACRLTQPGYEDRHQDFRIRDISIDGFAVQTVWPDKPIVDNNREIGTNVGLDTDPDGNRATSWVKGSFLDNTFALQGPIHVPYIAGAHNVDTNNPDNVFMNVAELLVAPRYLDLNSGDIVSIECEKVPTKDGHPRDFSGYWRVNVGDPLPATATERGSTGIAFDYLVYADGSDASGALGAGPIFTAKADKDGIAAVTTASQWSHMGGRVRITKITEGVSHPVAFVSAKWTKNPYIRVEAIQNDVMKDSYTFPHMKNEIYKETVRVSGTGAASVTVPLDPRVQTQKISFRGIRLLSGFSSMHIYACLDETESRRLELYTALGDCFFDISNLQIRINQKFCLQGQEPKKWLFEQHKRVTESKLNYVQWKNKRMVISVDCETLALPEFFDGAEKLYDCEVNFDVSYSPVFMNLATQIRSTENTLVVGNHYSGHHALSQDFVDNLAVSARVVLEYRRKAVSISREGDISIVDNGIRQPDSGLTMTQPQQTVLRSGGDPEAHLRSFD
jgi:hypothetical protein